MTGNAGVALPRAALTERKPPEPVEPPAVLANEPKPVRKPEPVKPTEKTETKPVDKKIEAAKAE